MTTRCTLQISRKRYPECDVTNNDHLLKMFTAYEPGAGMPKDWMIWRLLKLKIESASFDKECMKRCRSWDGSRSFFAAAPCRRRENSISSAVEDERDRGKRENDIEAIFDSRGTTLRQCHLRRGELIQQKEVGRLVGSPMVIHIIEPNPTRSGVQTDKHLMMDRKKL